MYMRKGMVLAIAGLVAVGCDTRDVETDPGLLPADEPAAVPQEDVLVARSDFQPTAQAGDLNVSGWAELRQRGATWDDGLELRVHLMGLSEGDHAWHIHQGTCDSPGQVVLPLSDMGDRSGITGDLSAGSDGMVEETVTIDRDHLAGLNLQTQPHSINVHLRSGDDPGPPIACANIETTGAAGMQPATGTPGY
jgi:Cu/Zn superoxide dismutase